MNEPRLFIVRAHGVSESLSVKVVATDITAALETFRAKYPDLHIQIQSIDWDPGEVLVSKALP